MWYQYLNREQPYLRSYRTHNLWLNQFHKKIRTPRAQTPYVQMIRRLGKTPSGVRFAGLV